MGNKNKKLWSEGDKQIFLNKSDSDEVFIPLSENTKLFQRKMIG